VCVGDEVFAQDEDTGEVSLRTVTHTFVRKSAPIVAVTLMSMASPVVADTAGDHAQTPTDSSLVTLSTTEEHPFLVESAFASAGGGTSDTTNWVQAANLKPGDEIVTARGEPAVVVAVRFTGRQATVYNIEVEGLHNYRVGSDGVVVHNGDPCDIIIRKAMGVRSNFRRAPQYVRDEIERIEVPNAVYGQPHITHRNGSALNWDGSIRDDHRGTPAFSRRVREWLEAQGWGK
jgi:hypothetical protein